MIRTSTNLARCYRTFRGPVIASATQITGSWAVCRFVPRLSAITTAPLMVTGTAPAAGPAGMLGVTRRTTGRACGTVKLCWGRCRLHISARLRRGFCCGSRGCSSGRSRVHRKFGSSNRLCGGFHSRLCGMFGGGFRSGDHSINHRVCSRRDRLTFAGNCRRAAGAKNNGQNRGQNEHCISFHLIFSFFLGGWSVFLYFAKTCVIPAATGVSSATRFRAKASVR